MRNDCLIHCTKDSGDLSSVQDLQSWQTLVRAAEILIQCIDLRADENIRKTALAKNDSKLLAIVSRDLVAAEACYHGTCHREYTRPKPETGSSSTLSFTSQDDEYACTESAAYEKLFDL